MQGKQEGLRETARNMLDAGKYELEEIEDISGLSIDEVKEMKMKYVVYG